MLSSKLLPNKIASLFPVLKYSQSFVPLKRPAALSQTQGLRPASARNSTNALKPSQTFTPLLQTPFRSNRPLRSLLKTAKRYFSTAEEPPKQQQAPSGSEEDLAELKKYQEMVEKAKNTNDFSEFVTYTEAVLAYKRKIYGENYTEGQCEDLKNVGFGYLVQGKYTEALFYFDEALKYAKKESELMEVNLNLGQLYMTMNNPDAAKEVLDEAYVHAKTLFSSYLSYPGETLLKVAYQTIAISRNLTELYGRRLNRAQVKIILGENLQMFGALIRVNRVFSRQNLSDILGYFYGCSEELIEFCVKDKDFAGAEKAATHLIEAAKHTNNPFYGSRGHFNQGMVMNSQGKFMEALVHFNIAKDSLETFLSLKSKEYYDPAYHQQYVSLMYMIFGGLSNCFLKLNMRDRNYALMDEVEAFFKSEPTEDPNGLDQIRAKKAEMLLDDKKFPEATAILLELESNTEKLDLGLMKNVVFRSYVLAMLSTAAGESEKYEEGLKAALANEPLVVKLVKEFPDRKESIVQNKYTVGALYGRLKKFKEAEKYLKDSLEIYKRMEGKTTEVIRVITDLAYIYEEMGEKDKARTFFMKSLELRQKMQKAGKDEGIDDLKSKIEELKPEKKPEKKKKN